MRNKLIVWVQFPLIESKITKPEPEVELVGTAGSTWEVKNRVCGSGNLTSFSAWQVVPPQPRCSPLSNKFLLSPYHGAAPPFSGVTYPASCMNPTEMLIPETSSQQGKEGLPQLPAFPGNRMLPGQMPMTSRFSLAFASVMASSSTFLWLHVRLK